MFQAELMPVAGLKAFATHGSRSEWFVEPWVGTYSQRLSQRQRHGFAQRDADA
jgi:hypothetical protein